jgi:pilus assembly protein CpaB
VASFVPRAPAPQRDVVVLDAAPEPARAPDTRTVIVAVKPLQFGTVLTADVLSEVQWPVASVPAGAFSSREALLGPGGQRTVLTTIDKGEPVRASKITGPGQRGSLSAVIEEGMKAVTIRVDDVLGVAGFIQPGDRVDVILTRNERAPSASGKPGGTVAFSDVLLEAVRVLAIDQVAERAGQPKPAKAVTIEVTAEGATKVSLGQDNGRLSLALLPVGSSSAADYRRIDLEDLGGQRPNGVRPPPPAGTEADSTRVTVTRGTDRVTYEINDNGRREVVKPGKPPQLEQ